MRAGTRSATARTDRSSRRAVLKERGAWPRAFTATSGVLAPRESGAFARLLLSVNVAAQDHQGFDGLRHERGGLVGVRERVRAWALWGCGAGVGRIDLRLD